MHDNDTMNNDRKDYCENENELYTKNNVGVHTTILSHNDNVIIPLFRNNLIRICINECVKVFAIVDTGAVTTAMSLQTLRLLRKEGQNCKLYKTENIELTAINGNRLNIIGQTYVRLKIGQHLIRTRVYVITNMQHYFVIGNDIMTKYLMQIDFEKEQLFVKQKTLLYTVQGTKLLPNTETIISVSPINPLCIGQIGSIDGKPLLSKFGLKSLNTIELIQPQLKFVQFKIQNPSNRTIYLKKNLCIGEFNALNKTDLNQSTRDNKISSINSNTQNINRDNESFNNEIVNEDIVSQEDDYNNDREFNIPKSVKRAIDDMHEDKYEFKIDLKNAKLTPSEKERLVELLNRNREVFATHAYDVGTVKGVTHKIKLIPNAKIIKCNPRRSNPKQREIIDKQVAKMLKAGIIQPSNSDYCSPTVLVAKKVDPVACKTGNITDNYRHVEDYRLINSITVKDAQPTPLINDILNSLPPESLRYMSSIDLLSGYHQILMDPESRKYTAFATHNNLYEYVKMPMGLTGSSSTFIRTLTKIFGDMLYKGIAIYLDDILIYSETMDEHLTLLEEVFRRLKAANLKLKLSKCKFALQELLYLGYKISERGIEPDDSKIKILRDYPPPTLVAEVRSFLGMAGWYRKMIEKYATIAKPLINLTKKYAKFIWDETCKNSFETLKQKLTSKPIIAFANHNLPFNLYTDSSGYSISAILCQVQEGRERVIAYAGRNLSPAEQKYSICERECLAVFYAFKQYDSYLRFNFTQVYTDCKPLTEILMRSEPTLRIAKWTYYLSQYNFTVTHFPGKTNPSDGLSRCIYDEPITEMNMETPRDPFISAIIDNDTSNNDIADVETHNDARRKFDNNRPITQMIDTHGIHDVNDSLQPHDNTTLTDETSNVITNDMFEDLQYGDIINVDILSREQLLDADLKPLIEYLLDNVLPIDDKLARKIIMQSDNYSYTDKLLYHYSANKRKGIENARHQLVIPKNLRLPILIACHDRLAHRDIPATFETIFQNYFWHNMHSDIAHHIRSCEVCSQNKHTNVNSRAPLKPIDVANTAFSTYCIDIVGKLNTTKNGNQYIIVIVDTFTKYCEYIPVKTIGAHTIATAFFDNIICRYGCYKSLISDRGTTFLSSIFKHLLNMCQVTHLASTSYRHQTAGAAERQIQSLKRYLAKHCNESLNDWDQHLAAFRFAHAISINESTRTSPFMLMFGRQPTLSLDVALAKPDNKNNTVERELDDVVNRVKQLENIVQENIKMAQEKMTKQYNKHSTPIIYKQGMHVWLYVYQLSNKYSNKMSKRYIGPFVITACEGSHNFKLRSIDTNKDLPLPVHADRLQPCVSRTIKPPIPIIDPPLMSNEEEKQLAEAVDNNEGHMEFNAEEADKIRPNQNVKNDTQYACENENVAESIVQLPRAQDIEINPDKPVHSIPKATISDGTKFYYIIYEDQDNKTIGQYVKENELSETEKRYIEENKDNIRFLRYKLKLPADICLMAN